MNEFTWLEFGSALRYFQSNLDSIKGIKRERG